MVIEEDQNRNFTEKDNKVLIPDKLYSIIASQTLYPGSIYVVGAVLHKSDQPCKIRIGIKGESINDFQVITLEPGLLTHTGFLIPDIKDGDYELQAEGITGIDFKETRSLNYEKSDELIFIQTDKATYKPGDEVKFRVLFMDETTRPLEVKKPIIIDVFDGDKNRIKQWNDVQLVKGVYSDRLQLSEQPVLGEWTVNALIDGLNVQTKRFDVARYVLPKFEVVIEAVNNVTIEDDLIKVKVVSKYTYGKNVKGKALVTIKPSYFYERKYCVERTIDIDGTGFVEFSIKRDLQLDADDCHYIPTFEIQAQVAEALTGNEEKAKPISVQLHLNRYKIEGIDMDYEYKPHEPFTIKVLVKNIDGTPVTDERAPVKLLIEKKIYEEKNSGKRQKEIIELQTNLDNKGFGTFTHTFEEDADDYYGVSGNYLGSESYLLTLYKCRPKREQEDYFDHMRLVLLSEEPRCGDIVQIEVKFTEPIPFFVYALQTRNKIVTMDLIRMENNAKTKMIEILSTSDLMPNAIVYVHYIFDGKLHSEEVTIHFKETLKNQIEIIAPEETQPGENVSIKIKTNSDSYVGLLAVDQSVLLMSAGNDISKDLVFNRYNEMFSEYRMQLITMTNAQLPSWDCLEAFSTNCAEDMSRCYDERSRSFQGDSRHPIQEIQTRKEFPETWIFADFESCSPDGITLNRKIPDTITSWIITGFAINSEAGLAITENPIKVKTFRPFFITTNLPYSIKRGEQVTIPVIVFNYMSNDIEADITLDNSDNEFELIDVDSDTKPTKYTKHTCVAGNSGANVNFTIRPKRVGSIILKITATCPIAGDAIHKELKVEAEGITLYKNHDYFLYSEEGVVDVTKTVHLNIPENVVPDSEFIEATIMGNVLGTTIMNIDKLVRMPYGCGEQNMVNFVPNILVLSYLESVKKISEGIEAKAKRFLEIGYQRELTYKHDNGSYSAFGKSDPAGSTWLTAYVMRSFYQARKYIDIDSKILEEGFDFLAQTQVADGSFEEKGQLFDSAHMNDLGLTAFVLLAFMESVDYVDKYKEFIDRSYEYLQQNVGNCDDLYALAIVMYALQKRQSESVHEILVKLEALARINADHKWWTKAKKMEVQSTFGESNSNDVEITGYILMTLLDMNITALPIVKWLISQRNSNGGFNSTQETVVGLWALIKFAQKVGAGNSDINIQIDTGTEGEEKRNFKVNNQSALVVQGLELPKKLRQLTFSGKGQGTCIFQISYRYNILEKNSKPHFKLRTNIKPTTCRSHIKFDVFAQYAPDSDTEEIGVPSDITNMVVLEVSLPSGYIVDTNSFDQIEQIERIKRVETKNENTNIVIYFENLRASVEHCIPIQAELVHNVCSQKPVPIIIYDYYDNQKRATEFYEI